MSNEYKDLDDEDTFKNPSHGGWPHTDQNPYEGCTTLEFPPEGEIAVSGVPLSDVAFDNHALSRRDVVFRYQPVPSMWDVLNPKSLPVRSQAEVDAMLDRLYDPLHRIVSVWNRDPSTFLPEPEVQLTGSLDTFVFY